MESRGIFLFGVLFCVACSIISVSAGGKGWKKCGDGEINIEEVFRGQKECDEQYKSDEERRRRRSPHGGGHCSKNMCARVCQWKKIKFLDETGKFSESGAQEMVNKVYPESKRTEILSKIKTCSTEHSSKFSMDDKCNGYKDFKKCVYKSHMEVCGVSFGTGDEE